MYKTSKNKKLHGGKFQSTPKTEELESLLPINRLWKLHISKTFWLRQLLKELYRVGYIFTSERQSR